MATRKCLLRAVLKEEKTGRSSSEEAGHLPRKGKRGVGPSGPHPSSLQNHVLRYRTKCFLRSRSETLSLNSSTSINLVSMSFR